MPSTKNSLFVVKNLILWGTGSISVIVLIFFAGIWHLGDRLLGAVGGLFQPQSATSSINIPTLIVQQIQEVEELTTTVYSMETTVPASAERKFGDFVLATTKLLYIGQGSVRAGIDLNQLTAKDVLVSQDKVAINLPPPQILDSKIDVNNSYVYDYNRGFLNLGPDVAPHLQTLAQQQTLAEIVSTACREGILETANKQAKRTLGQLLSSTGYEQIEIITTAPSLETCQAGIIN